MSTERSDDDLLRIVLLVLAAIVLIPVVMMVFAVPMMGWWGGGMGGRFSVWGLGIILVPLVVLAGLGYILYRGLDGGGGGSTRSTDRALEELRLAYARGDLSDEEFEERRAKLRREESE